MIRAADHVIEVGPEPGAAAATSSSRAPCPRCCGSLPAASPARIFRPGRRRSRRPRAPARAGRSRRSVPLRATNAPSTTSPALLPPPLRRLVCLSGVSGSGKSTLLDNVIYQGLLAPSAPARRGSRRDRRDQSGDSVSEVVLVDQSPLSRTPRSNPALYTEAWDLIRELYAATPAAQEAGFSASSFSFNSGDGRCDHCQGLGYERVEMQFLSDVFVPCPVCEGRRFKPEVLAISGTAAPSPTCSPPA
jgi:excinuclease ABC subunit A